MRATQAPTRTSRSRVLVVGIAAGDAQRIIDEADRQPLHAANIFEALGQLANSSAREPIASVIVSSSALGDSPRVAAASIRRLDPSVQLVLVCNGSTDDLAAQQLSDLFDHVVLEGDGDALRRALRSDAAAPSDAAAASAASPRASSTDAAHLSSTAQDLLPSEPSTRVRTESADSAESMQVQTPQRREVHAADIAPDRSSHDCPQDESPATSGTTPGHLGDVDLIDSILHRPHELAERAIRLIVQQTGHEDLQLLTAEPSSQSLNATAVRHDDQLFGYLASSSAGPDELAAWAEWLARWLALAESHARHREWAYTDDLTGACNRRYFNEFLAEVIRTAQKQRRAVTLMVFDLDDFKRYNDKFGHEAGDEILRETVKLLTSVIRKGDRVCRIGGDEFAVIFADPEGPRETGSAHPETVEQIARRFQDQICAMKFPKLAAEAPGPLTISAGLATYPWDGHDPASLLKHADELALESKRRGKNVMTLGPGADRRRADLDDWSPAG